MKLHDVELDLKELSAQESSAVVGGIVGGCLVKLASNPLYKCTASDFFTDFLQRSFPGIKF